MVQKPGKVISYTTRGPYRATTHNINCTIPKSVSYSESKSLRCPLRSSIPLTSSWSDNRLSLSLLLSGGLLRLLVLLHLHLRLLHLLLHSVQMTQSLLPVLGAVALYLD